VIQTRGRKEETERGRAEKITRETKADLCLFDTPGFTDTNET